MSFLLMFLFVILMIISAFMQAEDNPKKNFISPALTAFCGIMMLVGTLAGNVSFSTGLTLLIALILLALSDFMFERSAQNENLFPIAMILGVLSGFAIGILFNILANAAGLPLWIHGIFLILGIAAGIFVYQYLKVDDSFKIPVYIYLVQVMILLTGGMGSLYIGKFAFAIWGIFIFTSDSLVGLRAFPNPERPIKWLDTRRILFLIIVLYYSAQYALVSWAI